MARTDEGVDLTEQHRAAQLSQRARALRGMTQLWASWDPTRPRSFDTFSDRVVDLVRSHHEDSADIAARYFEDFRRAEDVGGAARARRADRITPGIVKRSMRMTGFVGTMRLYRKGFSPQAAKKTGMVHAAGSVARMVLNGGRDTVIESASADKRALGWARVTDGDPCYFCAMVASRGPVFSADTAEFEAHDHCGCAAEPHYDGAEWPGRAREFEDLWISETSGLSGDDAVRAFRHRFER